MNNECFKFAGFNSALFAILMLLIAPVAQAQGPAEPPSLTKERILECQSPDVRGAEVLERQAEIWRQAWGRELAAGQQSMALQATASPEVWEVFLGDKTNGLYADRGTFLEEARYPVDLGSTEADAALVKAAEASHVQRYVVAGILVGSTGNSLAVTAVATEINRDKTQVAQLFTVLEMSADSRDALGYAETFVSQLETRNQADSLSSGEPQSLSLGFEKSGPQFCVNACHAKKNRDIDTCNLQLIACEAVVAGTVATCILGCAALAGPALAICLGGCDAILVGGLATCLATNVVCKNKAWDDLGRCLSACNCSNSFICLDGGPNGQ